MAYNLALAAGKRLSRLGDKRLAVGEKRYGSGDDYVNRSSTADLISRATVKISQYLSSIKEGRGNPEILLGNCENQLRFILAKLTQDRSTSQENTELQTLLRKYLADHPGGERELADEFNAAVGTISRWANGHCRPAPAGEQAIITFLKKKMQRR